MQCTSGLLNFRLLQTGIDGKNDDVTGRGNSSPVGSNVLDRARSKFKFNDYEMLSRSKLFHWPLSPTTTVQKRLLVVYPRSHPLGHSGNSSIQRFSDSMKQPRDSCWNQCTQLSLEVPVKFETQNQCTTAASSVFRIYTWYTLTSIYTVCIRRDRWHLVKQKWSRLL